MAEDNEMIKTFFKQFHEEANNDRLLKGFSEVIHLREQTTFANQLKRQYQEEKSDQMKMSHMKDNDFLHYIERHKLDIMKLLEANLSRLTEFEPRFSLLSKLTAEQNVDRVMEKLKNQNIIKLGKLLRPDHAVNGVYLPPRLRMMVDKKRSKTQVKAPERSELDLEELELILQDIGLLQRSPSVEAVTKNQQNENILVHIDETPLKRLSPSAAKVVGKTPLKQNLPKNQIVDKPSMFAYIVAKKPGTEAFDQLLTEAQIREKELREKRIMKEYSLDGDEKALSQLLDSDAQSVASSLKPRKHIEQPKEVFVELQKKYSISGGRDPFRNSHGEFQIDRPGLQVIMKDADSMNRFPEDIDNSDEDDIDDDVLKARIKARKSKQRELRNHLKTTLTAAKQVLSETETVKSLIKYDDAIDLGIDLKMLMKKQEDIRQAMQVDFDDESDIKRAMQVIRDMKAQTAEEMRGQTVRTVPDEIRQTDFSETLSSISEIMTPVIGHKYNRSTAEGKEPKYNRSTAEGKDPIPNTATYLKTASKDKSDAKVRDSFAKTSAQMQDIKGEGSVFGDETESIGATTMPLPIELEQMSQLTEQVDETFLQECITELKQFIEEQIKHLTKLPDEVLNPAPKWPATMNSSVGKDVPMFKASFIGHLYQIKAKRDKYPSRLKQFNRERSTKAALFNELIILKQIYDSVYKVRTERSQAASQASSLIKLRSPQVDDRPTPLEHQIQEWNPISISRIENNPIYRFDQTLFVNSQTQSPNSIEIDAIKRVSERTLIKTINDNENEEGSQHFNIPDELGQHESLKTIQKQEQSVSVLLTNTFQSNPNIKLKGLDDNRKLIKLKYDESLKSPAEYSLSSQRDNTIDIYAQVIEVSGHATHIPATAEEQPHLACNESFDNNLDHNLTSGQQSPLGTGNWPRPQLQSDSNSQPQTFEPEALRHFQIKMDELSPSLNSDMSHEIKQTKVHEVGRFTRDTSKLKKTVINQKYFDFPALFNEPERANLQSILSIKNQHYGAQQTKQREILQLILNQQSFRDEEASTSNINDGNNVGLNILNSTIQTGSPAATQQSFNLLSEISRKQQPIKGLAKHHEIRERKQRKQSGKQQNKDGMILIGELKNTMPKQHLTRNDSADTINEEQPGISEKRVGPSTHQFNSPEVESGGSHNTSKVRLIDNKLKQMSPKYVLGSAKRSQIIAQVNTNNFKMTEGQHMEVRPPDTQSMKDLPIHNEDLVDPQIVAPILIQAQENTHDHGQAFVAKSSTRTYEVNKLYQTLAKISVGSSAAESSGLTQLEMFQQHFLRKQADDSRVAMRLLVTPIPFKPIALENHSMQPLSQSISKKLRSTTLQHSIIVQREKQMRKLLIPRHHTDPIHQIEIASNPIILKPKMSKKFLKDIQALEQTHSMPQPINRVGRMPHIDAMGFSSGESDGGEMLHIQTQEIRAASQLENPLLAMNDIDTQITVVGGTVDGNQKVPLNHHSTVGTLKGTRSPVLQNSKSPSLQLLKSPLDKSTFSQDLIPITLITKAEHMVAKEGSPSQTPKASSRSNLPKSNTNSPRNKQVNSYKQGVLFGFPLTAEQLEVTALEGHFRSVTVLLPQDNDSQETKSPKKEQTTTLYKPQKQAKKKTPLPSVGKSTLMDGFLFESPLSLLPPTKTSPFSKTMIRAMEDNFESAVDERMPPILTNQRLRQTQFSGGMGTTFVSARNMQKSENRIANNFQVSIRNTRNADSQNIDGAKTQLFKPSDQKKLKIVQFGNDELPPIETSERTSKISTIIKPLKAGLNKFTLQPPNPRSSIGQTVASSFNRSNQFSDPAGRQSPKIKSGTVVLVEKIDVKRLASIDVQKRISPIQSITNLSQANDPQRDTKLLMQIDEKPFDPAYLRNNAVSSQTTLQQKEGTIELNSPFLTRGMQNFDIELSGGEVLTGKPSMVEIKPVRSREGSSGPVSAVGPWIPMDTKQYITIYDKLGANTRIIEPNNSPSTITQRSVWLDNEAFTGFDLKKKRKQKQDEPGIQFQLQGQAPPIVVKKKK